MPIATGAKYHYLDHDSDVVDVSPPTQNLWYEVFHAEDVRLLYCYIFQINTDLTPKQVQVRWTIDGNVYWNNFACVNNTPYWVFRVALPSLAGTQGLDFGASPANACFYICKRGQDFKVEVMMSSVPGANQRLGCYCVRETLEPT